MHALISARPMAPGYVSTVYGMDIADEVDRWSVREAVEDAMSPITRCMAARRSEGCMGLVT